MPLELEDLEQKNRNFICSCQKAYLSYAALFTHIKQKHGGKAPGEIVRPRSLNKRGRPRKSEKLGSQKLLRNESSDGYLANNNLKNIYSANEFHSDENEYQLVTKGFTSYKNSYRFHQSSNTTSKSFPPPSQPPCPEYSSMQILKEDDEENLDFPNPNNELSTNTLALASIVIGLQQFFKDVNTLEIVRDYQLEAFSMYLDLKQFHARKLLQKSQQNPDEDVFLLGNIICAFLNFCHQTLEERAAYQQIVLLMVCLLEHIKECKKGNILISCRKEVVHECLPSFFQQYLERVIINSKLNFWIFKSNNSFKVLIWFLNWLSAIEANYLKNFVPQKTIKQQDLQEEQPNIYEEQHQLPLHQVERTVEFQHPSFLKKVEKTEQLETENKTLSSTEKRDLENGCLVKEGREISKSVNSSEEEEKVEVSVAQSEEGSSDKQIDEDESENDKNELIGMERLSSQVR